MSEEERAVVKSDWPQPAAGAPDPKVLATDSSLSLSYRTEQDRFVVVRFPMCDYLIFGAPNDEALGGHPLSGRGLEFYAVHEVRNSSLVELLERRNAVHPRHDRDRFLRSKKHYIVTFHDSTLECVFDEGEWWKPTVRSFDTEEEADQFWRAGRDG